MNNPLYEQITSLSPDYIKEKFDEFLIEASPQGDPTSDLTVDDTKQLYHI